MRRSPFERRFPCETISVMFREREREPPSSPSSEYLAMHVTFDHSSLLMKKYFKIQ